MKAINQITRKEFISILANHKCHLITSRFLPFTDNEKICELLQTFHASFLGDKDFKTVEKVRTKSILFSDGSVTGWDQRNGKYEYYKYAENICFQKFSYMDMYNGEKRCAVSIYYFK